MDVQEFSTQVEDLDKKLERLRALYEQYFMGIEKLEPTVLRHEVEKRFRALRKERCPNTAVRFRFQTLIQRYTTLMSHWQRVCRAIEEGTYEPHVLRAQRLLEKREAESLEEPARRRTSPTATGDLAVDLDLTDAAEAEEEPETGDAESVEAEPRAARAPRPSDSNLGEEVARVRSIDDLRRLLAGASDLLRGTSASPPAPRAPVVPREPRSTVPPPLPTPALAVRSTPPALATRPAEAATPPVKPAPAADGSSAGSSTAAAPGGRLDEDKIRAVHEAFASAAKGAAGSVAVPSPTALRKSLEQELARMAQRHPGQRVDFRVDVRDGRPVIKSFVVPGKG
jgi:hypothetical protein